MKTVAAIFFVLLVFPFIIISEAQDESSNTNKKNEIVLSDNELILLFSVSIAIVVGIFLYLGRHWFSRKKDVYDEGNFDSKKNRDYEKYHSEWTSDEYGFKTKNKKLDDEFRKSSLPNYYKILGLSTEASKDEIKTRFRNLVKEWHPDRNKGRFTEKRMSEINKAYEVLSDEETRKNYDKYFKIS
jgi:hypothetical protein